MKKSSLSGKWAFAALALPWAIWMSAARPALAADAPQSAQPGSTQAQSLAIDPLPAKAAQKDVELARLNDANSENRLRAVEFLGKNRVQRAVPRLIALLKSEKNPAVREYAVDALAAIGDVSVTPVLRELAINDSQVGVRLGAVAALNRLGGDADWAALEKLAADPGQPAALRRSCLVVLGNRQDRQALKALKAAASDKDPEVRESAVEALGHLDQSETKKELQRALADEDGRVSRVAGQALERGKKRRKTGAAKRD